MAKPRYPNLEAELARKGITHTDLADMLGIKSGTLSPLMNGKVKMPLETAWRIRDFIDPEMQLEYLFAPDPILWP